MDHLLEEIFDASDEDVETFSDFVESSAGKNMTPNEVERIRSTASFTTETQRKFTIEHGRHESHYAWHISPVNERTGWCYDMRRVVYAIGKVIQKYIPDNIIIDVHLPDQRNGVDVLTIKANNVLDSWSIQEDTLAKVTGQLFEVLNAL